MQPQAVDHSRIEGTIGDHYYLGKSNIRESVVSDSNFAQQYNNFYADRQPGQDADFPWGLIDAIV